MAAIAELNVSDEMERLAALANEGYGVTVEARSLCGGPDGEEFTLAWGDFCDAVRKRDEVGTGERHWREVLDDDAASNWEQAFDVLCTRADEALLGLLTDRAIRLSRARRAA